MGRRLHSRAHFDCDRATRMFTQLWTFAVKWQNTNVIGAADLSAVIRGAIPEARVLAFDDALADK